MGSFDVFTIRQWREGYTIEVSISRPRNAPNYKYTKADMERKRKSAEMNYDVLSNKMFPTLKEVMEEVEKLQL